MAVPWLKVGLDRVNSIRITTVDGFYYTSVLLNSLLITLLYQHLKLFLIFI